MNVREKTTDVDLWLSDPLRYTIDLTNLATIAEMRQRVHDAEMKDASETLAAVDGLREMIQEAA